MVSRQAEVSRDILLSHVGLEGEEPYQSFLCLLCVGNISHPELHPDLAVPSVTKKQELPPTTPLIRKDVCCNFHYASKTAYHLIKSATLASCHRQEPQISSLMESFHYHLGTGLKTQGKREGSSSIGSEHQPMPRQLPPHTSL